jgi:hypothetical protein
MVIALAPVALAAALVALWQGAAWDGALSHAVATALAAFGSWALGRELDPDDEPAAFFALVVAVLLMLLLGVEAGFKPLLVLFVTLGLVRQVNRCTGLEARLSDSVLLLALTLWVVYGTQNPLFALVAGLSFALDGSLERPLKRQWLFALLSFGAIIVYTVDHDLGLQVYHVPRSLPQWLAAIAAVVFALNIFLTRSLSSVSDVGHRPLSLVRVRGGMVVALVAVIQGLPEVREVALLAAVLTGICLATAFKRSFRNPA